MKNPAKLISLAAISILTLTACATPTIQRADEPLTPDNSGEEITTEMAELLKSFPDISNITPGENINFAPPFNYTTLEEFYNQEIEWFDCTEVFECAPIYVPKDYSDPAAGMIYIAIVRLAATGTAKGSLLLNPGGPGSSGVDFAFNAAEFVTTEQVRENFDIIGFDPRGVGYSDSVYCGPSDVLDIAFLDPGPQKELGSPENIAESKVKSRYLAQACSNGTGDLLGYLDTISAAKDMDIIREVLGDRTINYIGFSYGTQLGATYAALFPNKIGRFVLDGAINPTLTPEQSTIRQAAGFELAFNNYIDSCRALNNCPVPGETNEEIIRNLQQFLLSLEETPLETTLDNELGIWPGIIGIISNLYSKSSWSTMTAAIRNAYEDQDGTDLLFSAYQYLERDTSGEYYGTISISNTAINCLDDNYSSDPAVIANTNDSIMEVAPLFGKYFTNPYLRCDSWLHEAKPAHALDFTVALSAPVLVIGTTGDPATPYQNAIDLADILNPGVLLTYDGEGHTIYANRSTCIDEVVDAYLLENITPKAGIICQG